MQSENKINRKKTDYAKLQQMAKSVTNLAGDLDALMEKMTAEVNAICESWTSTVSPVFQDDYSKLAVNAENIVKLAKELGSQAVKYADGMLTLEKPYSRPEPDDA